MKTATIAILAFIAGGLLVGLVVNQIDAARAAQQSVHLRSDIHDPMRTALDDIVATHDLGEHDLAEAKARMLAAKWTAFMDGGKLPEQFAPLIRELTTAPTTRASR